MVPVETDAGEGSPNLVSGSFPPSASQRLPIPARITENSTRMTKSTKDSSAVNPPQRRRREDNGEPSRGSEKDAEVRRWRGMGGGRKRKTISPGSARTAACGRVIDAKQGKFQENFPTFGWACRLTSRCVSGFVFAKCWIPSAAELLTFLKSEAL